MKRIVILRCLRSEENCTGAACFEAFNNRKGQFEAYGDEDIQIVAFMSCNGCGRLSFVDTAGLEEKIERILKIKPDILHIGICCKTRTDNNEYCPDIIDLIDRFRSTGIEVVWGTHSGGVRHKKDYNEYYEL